MKDARDILIEILGAINEECSRKFDNVRNAEKHYSEDKITLSKLEGRYEEADRIRDIISKIVRDARREE